MPIKLVCVIDLMASVFWLRGCQRRPRHMITSGTRCRTTPSQDRRRFQLTSSRLREKLRPATHDIATSFLFGIGRQSALFRRDAEDAAKIRARTMPLFISHSIPDSRLSACALAMTSAKSSRWRARGEDGQAFTLVLMMHEAPQI